VTTDVPPPFRSAPEQRSDRSLGQDTRLDDRQRPPGPFLTNRIRHVRRERKWSLRRLSEISRIPINALWRMEKGGLPMLDRAFQLASAFQITIYEVWNIPDRDTFTPPYLALLPDRIKIRAARNAQGWTLRDLAKAAGIAMSTLSQIERGSSPNLGNAVRIAVALGVPVHKLWTIPGQ
jgi:transcriptional regulator with XRE-family HTH domain